MNREMEKHEKIPLYADILFKAPLLDVLIRHELEVILDRDHLWILRWELLVELSFGG